LAALGITVVPLKLVWHQRVERDAGMQWLIAEFMSALREAPGWN
jgi:hypothetical protein